MKPKRQRKLVWRKENGFEGWACSNCGWIYSNPSLESADKEHREIVKEKFTEHRCAKYPRKPKKSA